MNGKTNERIEKFNNWIVERNPAEIEFHQAVREFAESVMPFVESNPKYDDGHILQRMVEPDRIIIFRSKSFKNYS